MSYSSDVNRIVRLFESAPHVTPEQIAAVRHTLLDYGNHRVRVLREELDVLRDQQDTSVTAAQNFIFRRAELLERLSGKLVPAH